MSKFFTIKFVPAFTKNFQHIKNFNNKKALSGISCEIPLNIVAYNTQIVKKIRLFCRVENYNFLLFCALETLDRIE